MENPSFIDNFPIKPSIYRRFSIAMFDYRSVVEPWNIICPFLLLYVACIPIHVCYSLSSFCCLWHAGLLYPHLVRVSASAVLQHFSMPPITCCCVVLPKMFGLSTLWLYIHIVHMIHIVHIVPIVHMYIYIYIYIYIALSVICPNSQPFAWSISHIFSASPIRSLLRFEETIREQRSRRDSEKCIVQLTGAVTLLAEPYCIKHPRCGWCMLFPMIKWLVYIIHIHILIVVWYRHHVPISIPF